MSKIKIYSPTQVAVASFIGGPFAAIYTLKKNYDALGKTKEAKAILVWGIVSSILMFSILPFLPAHFPNFVIPLAYTVTARMMAEQYQLPKKDIVGNALYEMQTNWKVCGLSIAFLIATVVLLLAWFFALDIFGIINLGQAEM